MRSIVLILLGLFPWFSASAQVQPPKSEAGFKHAFRRHTDGSLEKRFDALSCSLVLLRVANRLGTGFFVSADGDVATAAHVMGDKIFPRVVGGSGVGVTLIIPQDFSAQDANGSVHPLKGSTLQNNIDAFGADVALIKTGIKPPCWLKTGDDTKVRTGEPVITIGFPGLAFGSATLYSGLVSTAQLLTGLPIGKTPDGMPVTSQVKTIRVQMPISPGLSGAPLINSKNEVIGVITSAGAWNQDLDVVIALRRMQQAGQIPPGVNLPNIQELGWIAELGEILHDYASPGYGDAVPMRYLRPSAAATQKPAAPAH
ncbi:S1 family peptidase [Terriglobus aquaticus]|uniref:Serine protease n=1 Tax=Terriglobus aquaticus TaxID=940139 RepID=A0ABW9KMA4_9BACT|nr:serine protease [Terriglobus aquaticus]